MAAEILFWLGMAALAIFFAARLIRTAQQRTENSELAESFERQKTIEHSGFRGDEDFSYARERLAREQDEWAA